MGCFDSFCCFCAGPLCDARDQWLQELPGDIWPPADGGWCNPPGYPVPTKPRDEIVTITESDGRLWDDWVALGPMFAHTHYVSPPCAEGSYGVPLIDLDDTWADEGIPFLCIHRICLSIICRRLNVTPQGLWETFYGQESSYPRLPPEDLLNGLLKRVHYDIKGRQGQSFVYSLKRQEQLEDGSWVVWYDPQTMEECQWLLARPTVFPKVEMAEDKRLGIVSSPSTTAHTLLRVLAIPELFDLCISFLKSPGAQNSDHYKSVPHPDVLSTLLALLKTSRALYGVLLDRQDLFYQIVLDSGWMLPLCPADWAEWKAAGNPAPLPFPSECSEQDWRGYLLACVRREEPHIRNRERFHRMLVQFSLPTTFICRDRKQFFWSLGELERKPEFSEPEPWTWEIYVED